ncbi:MAG: toprim domain-containing protein [Candidatus Hodarchaeota archaeon]
MTEEEPESRKVPESETPAPEKEVPASESSMVNPPLTFELKNLDQEHPYLKERGLKPETIKEFGIGYCQRGLMKGRIAIPIHNENGELIAYAGRYPGDPPEGEPKYKLPPKFQKHYVLYNFHRARQCSEKHLILVEGFFDAMKLWQAGFKNVMALMGTVMSDEQEHLLTEALSPDGKLTLMLDPDEPGIKATEEITARLITKFYIKVIDPEAEPDELSKEKIKALLK